MHKREALQPHLSVAPQHDEVHTAIQDDTQCCHSVPCRGHWEEAKGGHNAAGHHRCVVRQHGHTSFTNNHLAMETIQACLMRNIQQKPAQKVHCSRQARGISAAGIRASLGRGRMGADGQAGVGGAIGLRCGLCWPTLLLVLVLVSSACFRVSDIIWSAVESAERVLLLLRAWSSRLRAERAALPAALLQGAGWLRLCSSSHRGIMYHCILPDGMEPAWTHSKRTQLRLSFINLLAKQQNDMAGHLCLATVDATHQRIKISG